jgi:hypothetical protein
MPRAIVDNAGLFAEYFGKLKKKFLREAYSYTSLSGIYNIKEKGGKIDLSPLVSRLFT